MMLQSAIKNRQKDFVLICAKYHVEKLYAFGSSVRADFDPEKSDLDFIVKLSLNDPVEYGETMINLWDAFESFFMRKVDLLTDGSIRNPYLKESIEATKILIYDGQGEEVFV